MSYTRFLVPQVTPFYIRSYTCSGVSLLANIRPMLKPGMGFILLALKVVVARHCIFGMFINVNISDEVLVCLYPISIEPCLVAGSISNDCNATLFSPGINMGVDDSICFPLPTPIKFSA